MLSVHVPQCFFLCHFPQFDTPGRSVAITCSLYTYLNVSFCVIFLNSTLLGVRWLKRALCTRTSMFLSVSLSSIRHSWAFGGYNVLSVHVPQCFFLCHFPQFDTPGRSVAITCSLYTYLNVSFCVIFLNSTLLGVRWLKRALCTRTSMFLSVSLSSTRHSRAFVG